VLTNLWFYFGKEFATLSYVVGISFPQKFNLSLTSENLNWSANECKQLLLSNQSQGAGVALESGGLEVQRGPPQKIVVVVSG
jgi:hypothetical protein